MDHYPKMLLRFPAQLDRPVALQDGAYDTLIVADDAEEKAAHADGWREGTAAARAVADEVSNAPPTRSELEAKARELDIKFDGRTSDKKLSDLIAAKLAT